jgi:hypothetical protein
MLAPDGGLLHEFSYAAFTIGIGERPHMPLSARSSR